MESKRLTIGVKGELKNIVSFDNAETKNAQNLVNDKEKPKTWDVYIGIAFRKVAMAMEAYILQ